MGKSTGGKRVSPCIQCRKRKVCCPRDGLPCSACSRSTQECGYPSTKYADGIFRHYSGPGKRVVTEIPQPPSRSMEYDRNSQKTAHQFNNNIPAPRTWSDWDIHPGQASDSQQGRRPASQIRRKLWYKNCERMLQRDCNLGLDGQEEEKYGRMARQFSILSLGMLIQQQDSKQYLFMQTVALSLLKEAIKTECGSTATRETVYVMAITEVRILHVLLPFDLIEE